MCHHRRVTAFDLLIRGGTVIDGTGTPGIRADVGVTGDRIQAVGDLTAAVEARGTALVIDATDRVVCPGFVDPHGHSDASILLDPAVASHLHQGFTTQLSGNCGDTLAPLAAPGREMVELAMAATGLEPTWRTFGEYLATVERLPLGPNHAFLVGHGTIRGAVLGPADRATTDDELTAMVRHLDEALDAGALGLSSGLIYPPGIHAPTDELIRLATVTAKRGGLYATHIRNESDGLFDALDEAIETIRAAGSGGRLQVSHLKAGSLSTWGRGPAAVERLERARADGLDVAADQYPYTAAATTLEIVLPPAMLAQPIDAIVAALGDLDTRDRLKTRIRTGLPGWENAAADPGWGGLRIADSRTHADWAGHTLAELATELERDPADVAFDLLADDRLDTSIVIECMSEADVEAIMAVPWVAVCTDASGHRPGHPLLGSGVPHPRAYGSAPRVLGRYVRERGVLPLGTAIAKLTSVPAARLGLAGRGTIRPKAFADLVVFHPATVLDEATELDPHRYPIGIEHVIVNGVPAILDGRETGRPAGRLLRRGG
jgi:N-acyl-D-aspartate/D-glutamate deacylase